MAAEQARPRPRIPEVLAAERMKLVAEGDPVDAGGPEARDQRARARAREALGQEAFVLEHGDEARVGEEAEEAGREREREGALAEPFTERGRGGASGAMGH